MTTNWLLLRVAHKAHLRTSSWLTHSWPRQAVKADRGGAGSGTRPGLTEVSLARAVAAVLQRNFDAARRLVALAGHFQSVENACSVRGCQQLGRARLPPLPTDTACLHYMLLSTFCV